MFCVAETDEEFYRKQPSCVYHFWNTPDGHDLLILMNY